MRVWATLLLVAAAAIYAATELAPEPNFWIRLIQAGAEAAMIGGLADWFAVTALFRRPLGLPIPHTALIPSNKDRIGDSLGAFVENYFLTPENVAAKLRSIGAARRLSGWLSDPVNAEHLAARLLAVLPFALNAAGDAELRRFLRGALDRQLRDLDLAPILGDALALLTASGHHMRVFDRGVAFGRQLLAERWIDIYLKVEEHSHWLVPSVIDRKIARRIIDGVESYLEELERPDSDARRRFERWLQIQIVKLRRSRAMRRKVAEVKNRILGGEEAQAYLESLWDKARAALVARAEDPDSSLRAGLANAIQALGRSLAGDPAMQARFDQRLERLTVELIAPSRREISRFLAEVVRSWDARTVSERLELAVGRDLQFIRINGSLVGALVGCVIFLIVEGLRRGA